MRYLSKLRIIGIVVLALVLLLVAAIVILQTRPAREYATRTILNALKSRGLDVQAKDISYSVTGLSVTFNDMVIRTVSAPALPPVFAVDKLTLGFGLRPLLSGDYVPQSVVASRPRIHLVTTQQGATNLPVQKGGTGGQQGVFLEKVRATDGSLLVENRARNFTVLLPRWRLSLKGDRGEKTEQASLETQQAGRVSLDGRTVPVDALSADAVFHPEKAQVNNLALTAAGSHIVASGDVEDYSGPVMNLKGQADLNLAPLAMAAGVKPELTGRLKGPFTATGPLDDLHVASDLQGSGLTVAGFRDVSLKADTVYSRKPQTVQVRSLDVSAPAAQGTASGTVSLRESGRSSLQGRIVRAELEQLSGLSRLPFTLASRAAGTWSAQWPGLAFSRANGRGDLQLTATRTAPARKVLPVSGPVTITAQGGRLAFSSNSLEALASRTEGQAAIQPTGGLAGNLRTQIPRTENFLASLNQFLGRSSPLVPVRLAGAANVATGLGGTVRNPAVNLNVSAPSLDIAKFDNVRLTASALYTPERINVRNARLLWTGQTITVTGNIGLQTPSPTLDLTANARGAALSALPGGLGELKNIPNLPKELGGALGATASVQAHIGGTLQNPRTTITRSGAQAPGFSIPGLPTD